MKENKVDVLKQANFFLGLIQTKDILALKSDIEQLRKVIEFFNRQYYVHDSSLISDKEYDDLFKALVELEKAYPELVINHSPTQRVGNDITEQFPTEQHLSPMLSLENTYNEADIIEWSTKVEDKLPNEKVSYTTEPKFDGAGISVVYEGNHLKKALTRGDGTHGEVITQNAKQIFSVPLHADFLSLGITKIEIRGEVMMSKKRFVEFNELQKSQGLPALINPRNAASGSLRMKSTKQIRERKLEVFFYHISYYEAVEGKTVFHSHSEVIETLDSLGFQTPLAFFRKCSSVEEIIQTQREFENLRDKQNYEMDGLVVKVDNIAFQKQLGFTSHHPRWAVAYKFKARQMNSTILDVHFQVGRTGIITPVAKIKPIELSGATLSSISLFNERNILEKDFRIHDTVLVERAGDVIPYLVKSFPELRTGDEQVIAFPKQCPCCLTPLVKEESLEAWVCPNKECKEQVLGSLIHFASRDAMDIRSLGDANILRFYELGFLKTLTDIYRLPYDTIRNLKGMGDKSADNLQKAIEDSKSRPPEKFLYALGITHVGQVLAKKLCKRYKNILQLQNVSLEELEQMEDVGPKVAKSIYDFFHHEKNIQMLSFFKEQGLCLESNNAEINPKEHFLEGKSFLFTGTLLNRKREEAESLVEKFGGTIATGVNKKLHFLVVGEKAGSKLEKAQKIATITILDENQFEQLLTTKSLQV